MKNSWQRRLNMYPYIPNTPQDEQEMLQAIGLDSMDLLFEDIPKDVRLTRPLNIPPSKSELEVSSYLKSLADKNCSVSRMACFLGAGAYDHYIPSVIDAIISRSEFYTSYTPYQPEISQGTLQYIFEYQTLISNLTGMDLANASLYDGGTAVTEAALMACAYSRKGEIIVSAGVNPQARRILKTYAHAQNLKVVEVETKEGVTDAERLNELISDEYKKSKYYLTSSIPALTTVGSNTSINRINQMLKAFTDWNATNIDDRQAMLSRLAKEVWKIEEYK
jgi:glycine dehydrogenase subunit 1